MCVTKSSLLSSAVINVLSFASLYIGDSGTTATEAACLGVPAIRCNSFACSRLERSNFVELEKKYGLLFNYGVDDQNKAIDKALELVQEENLRERFSENWKKLLEDKVDITSLLVWLVENYPRSVRHLMRNKTQQYRFK